MKRIFLFAFVAALLAACATPTRLTNTWRDSTYAGAPFRHVLVMGFGSDGATRRVFEDEFVKSLQTTGVTATASYTLESGVSETDIDKVRELVKRSGADGVLTTRLVGLDKHTGVMPGQMMVVPTVGYRRGLYGYYSSAVVMQSPPTAYSYEILTLETNLWHVIGEHLVWSGTTETFAPENTKKTTQELAQVVVKTLRAQGLW